MKKLIYLIYNRHITSHGWGAKPMSTLKSLIHCFELVYGLKVNWAKTHLLGNSYSEFRMQTNCNSVGVCEQKITFWILRFTFGRILEGCKWRLAIWKTISFLSKGELPLSKPPNPTFLSIIFHFLKFQRGHDGHRKTSNSIFVEGITRIDTTPYSLGGLIERNVTLLGKWLWRLFSIFV